MTDDLHKTTQDLIADYYTKSSRYSKSILLLAIIGVTGVILSASWVYQTRAVLQKQQKQIISLQQQLDVRVQDVQDQIGCVGTYFTQTDRANLKIKSLNDCTIQRIGQ